MNVLKKSIVLGGCVVALTLSAGNHLMAQGRNFDPAQFKQMRIDRSRDQLEIKDDTEWKAIEPLVGKVIDAQQEVISAIAVHGNRRIPVDTIKARIFSRLGDVYDLAALERDFSTDPPG